MIEKIEWKMIPRRRLFSLLGMAAALSLAVSPTDAEAQTAGMERRQKRRQKRVQRRYERRGGQPAQNAPGTGAPAAGGPATGAPAPSQPPQKQ
jgi:hypothetical protein